MKFLLIASYPLSILKFRGALIQALHEKGLEIHIAAPEFDTCPEERLQLEKMGYTVHDVFMQRTGTNPIADGKTLWALFRLMNEIQPDFVLGYTIKPVIYGTLAAWLARVPHRFVLVTGLGYAFQGVDSQYVKKSFFQKLVHQLYAGALGRTARIFFQNPDDEHLFRQMKIIQPQAKTVIVNGSGVSVLEYAVTPFPCHNQQPIVHFLLIARLLGDKGVREYAQAVKIISAKYAHVQFSLVGWIDENPDAIEQTELDEWVADRRLRFLGKLSDVRPAIADSSVYVLPSYREGTPRTVLEAMAMGRAVITTDAPGCRETVVDGLNGFLVPVKSVDALVRAMEKFIQRPELIEVMGAESRKIAENKFDVNAVNQVMLREMGL
jgi:glycosyltransferase involved in cell wall biosynthesis